jgi:hypothetical protein
MPKNPPQGHRIMALSCERTTDVNLLRACEKLDFLSTMTDPLDGPSRFHDRLLPQAQSRTLYTKDDLMQGLARKSVLFHGHRMLHRQYGLEIEAPTLSGPSDESDPFRVSTSAFSTLQRLSCARKRCLRGVLISGEGRAGRIAAGYPRRAFSTVAA